MITLKDVSKTYYIGEEVVHALDHANMEINEGEHPLCHQVCFLPAVLLMTVPAVQIVPVVREAPQILLFPWRGTFHILP